MHQFSFGNVLSGSFETLFRRLGHFLLLYLVVFVVSLVLAGVFLGIAFGLGLFDFASLEYGGMPDFGLELGILIFVAVLLFMFVYAFYFSALVRSAIDDFSDRIPNFSASFSTGKARMLPVFLFFLMFYLFMFVVLIPFGVVSGFVGNMTNNFLAVVIMLIPLAMLLIVFGFGGHAAVNENTGVIESFGRSRELTAGYRWHIFGLSIVYFLIYLGIYLLIMAISVAFSAMGAAMGLIGSLITLVLGAILGLWAAIYFSRIYYELLLTKDGGDKSQKAQVFE